MKQNPFISKLNLSAIGIGAPAGAVLGGLYYKFIGCGTGACPLTSKLSVMLVYGALLGGIIGSLVGDLFPKRKKPAADEAVKE